MAISTSSGTGESIDQSFSVQRLPRAAGRPSWLALMLVAALTLLVGLAAGYSLGSGAAASPSPNGAVIATPTPTPPGPSEATVVSLPTYTDLAGAAPGQILAGRLAIAGPCLDVVDESGTRWLPIWPVGYGYHVDGGILSLAGPAQVGDLAYLGGSEYHEPDFDFLQRYLVTPINPACRGGNYWLVTRISPVPQESAVVSCDPVPQQWSVDQEGSILPIAIHLTCEAAVATAEIAAAGQLAGATVTAIEFHFGRPCLPGGSCSPGSVPDDGYVVFHRYGTPSTVVSVSADDTGRVTVSSIEVGPASTP